MNWNLLIECEKHAMSELLKPILGPVIQGVQRIKEFWAVYRALEAENKYSDRRVNKIHNIKKAIRFLRDSYAPDKVFRVRANLNFTNL